MTTQKSTLSREPYKGTRDFYPEDMCVQQYIFNTMRSVVERYGYMEYGASILEETALYKAKTGEEIVNEQTYSFTDRGERDVTIRPEMTPTFARMVARKRQELPFPIRWYSIPNLFRYERPQRGRLREHWQLNVDIAGIESVEADAEIITVAYQIMLGFGAKAEQFEMRVNSRRLMNTLFTEYLQITEEQAHRVSKLIDRKKKIAEEEFEASIQEVIDEKCNALMEFLNATSVDSLPAALRATPAVKEVADCVRLLQERGVTNVVFDPTIMRGFDYYTGIVFEVFDVSPENNRSLFGGGRYDDLVSIFGVEKITAVGFGMGDVTIRDFLETYSLLPKYEPPTQLYICRTGAEYDTAATELAEYLRTQGVRVAVDYTNRKIGAQIKTAEKQSVPFIICVGSEEAGTKAVKLKNLHERKEYPLEWSQVAQAVQKPR